MITLCIAISRGSRERFENYARAPPPTRAVAELIGYSRRPSCRPHATSRWPSSIASLAEYERYREALAKDPDHIDVLRCAEQSGWLLVEDRSFMQRVS